MLRIISFLKTSKVKPTSSLLDIFRLVLTDAPNALWGRTILLFCYGILIIYLVLIDVFQPRISSSRHRGFWNLHLWSLPVVAIAGMMLRLIGTLEEGIQYNLIFSMMLHLVLMMVLVVGCIVEKSRKNKLNS